jgi:ssDNA-binding Zn-finger/Zn-ribbon topoisomerase 1
MKIEQTFFDYDPRFNGPHNCPKCAGTSQWKAIKGKADARIIRVACPKCGIYEEPYSALEDRHQRSTRLP